MSNVLPFARRRSFEGNRETSSGDVCLHRHLRIDQGIEIVTCAGCGATLLPLSALSMLAHQYGLALAQIERLEARLSLADARLIELSSELDTLARSECPRKQPPTKP
nr:hypothetical protein [Paraburkholderia sp. BL8N3]